MNDPSPEVLLERLVALDIRQLDEDRALKCLDSLVEVAFLLLEGSATGLALSWGETLEGSVNTENGARLDYALANAWANRFREKGQPPDWAWEQPEFQKQIFYLRRAVNRKHFATMEPVLRCQILTNLANCLSTIGRFVEAQEYWSRAIELKPMFGMAVGNRASGAMSYMAALYDRGHLLLFGSFAFAELRAAIDPSAQYFDAGEFNAKEAYRGKLEALEDWIGGLDAGPFEAATKRRFSLGKGKAERVYREWCLKNRLFLNPLNDITQGTIAARDILSTPSISLTIPGTDPPVVIAFFNQMKQEFVSARWMFYQGTFDPKSHFSDSDVVMLNTLDFTSHGLPLEIVKASFRSAYSLFDKLAYFINKYFNLGVEDKRVAFRSIWYMPKKQDIRPDLECLENWPLRGLFWLSKDFYDEDKEAADPDAKALYMIRNHLEHKFLRIHEFVGSNFSAKNAMGGVGHSVERDEFDRLTLHLLKLCRAALIYLSLAMEGFERKNKPKGLLIPIALPQVEDEWKC